MHNPGIAMWTAATRKNYSRKTARYQSDVTDEDWRVIEPHLPPARTTGRPRAWPLREIVNGIFYVMRSGCAWRQLPTNLPPWARSIVGSPYGAMPVCSRRSTTCSSWPIVNGLGDRPAPLQFRTSIKLNW